MTAWDQLGSAVLVIYLLVWAGSFLGSTVLLIWLATTFPRLSRRGTEPARVPTRSAAVWLGAASLVGFSQGVYAWMGFPPDDASRVISAAPPLVFAVLAISASGLIVVMRTRGIQTRRTWTS